MIGKKLNTLLNKLPSRRRPKEIKNLVSKRINQENSRLCSNSKQIWHLLLHKFFFLFFWLIKGRHIYIIQCVPINMGGQ